MRIKYGTMSDMRIKDISEAAPKIDPEEIAKLLGGEICDPPPRFRHLFPFAKTKGISKVNEAFEAYDHMADKRMSGGYSVSPIYGCSMPEQPQKPQQDADIIHILFQPAHRVIDWLESQVRKVVGLCKSQD